MQGGGNIHCTSGCTLAGWTAGERDTNDRRSTTGFRFVGVAILMNKNRPWGGLSSMVGQQYLAIQGAGAYVEQSVCGLDASKDYHLTFAVTHRPGYGNDEKVKVTINGKTVWTADGKNGVPSNFGDIGIKFRGPASGQALIRFENDSPKGDKSIFVDNVKLGVFKVNKCTCANGTPATGLACKVDKSSTCAKCNSGFQLASGGKACVPKKCGVVQNGGMEEGASAITTTYKYTKPTRWTGSKNGIVVVRSGNKPWGGLTSHSGNYFISIQGSGAYVEQKVCGLVKGTTYTVSFAATHRPGYGNDEKLKVTVDGKTVWSAAANAKNGLPDKFGTFKATFTAQGGDATIRFENDSPKGDKSVFLDSVTIAKGGSVGSKCTGDLDNNKKVNVEDLLILLANYGGGANGQGKGDLDGKGKVNVEDLLILLANYGRKC